MSHRPIEDLEGRREAIFTREHAFVWASAGTGKTHTLTLRALFLLLDLGQVRLYRAGEHTERLRVAGEVTRSLVLTTFTRKAAAEMQERLYLYLDTIAQAIDLEDLRSSSLAQKDPVFIEVVERTLERIPGREFSRIKAGSQALLECASQLQISTIHSFAASILRRHPIEAGMRVDVRFLEEDEDNGGTLKELLIERWWQNEAFDKPANKQDLSTILQFIPVSDLQLWLEWAVQSPWLADHLKELSPQKHHDETLGHIHCLVQALESCRRGKIPQIVSKLNCLLTRVRIKEYGAWTNLTRFLYEQKEYLFRQGKHSPKAIHQAIESLPEATQACLETYLQCYAVCLRASLHSEHAELWQAWLRVLERFLEWSKSAATDELRVISFDEVIARAAALLKTSEEVRCFEFGRLRALLVDEFQDTDPAQLDLLACLLRRPRDCPQDVLGFFVGDVKQSIYRFRGVDIRSVLGFVERYETLVRPLRAKREFHLQTNFRSSESITGFTNYVFGERFDLARESDLLIPFRDEMGAPVQWIQLETGRENVSISAEDRRQLAAEATASVIKNCVQREVRYKEILVLTNNNRELDCLLPILRKAGIPVVASGTRTYFQNQEVLDLLNLLIALSHPLDSIAVAAVLKSPLVCLTDDEIHRLLEIIPPERLFHSDDAIPAFVPDRLQRRISALRGMAAERRDSPLRDWLQKVREFIPDAAYTRSYDREGHAIVRMRRLLKVWGDEVLRGNCPPVVWLLKQRSRARSADRWDEDSGEDVTLSDEGVDAVRAMTIHKAKGLESRLVIIYSWTLLLEESLGAHNGVRGQLLDLQKDDGSRLRALSLPWGPIRIVTDHYLEAMDLENRYSSEEAMRLTYVASTRACEQLFLLHSPSRTDLLDRIWSNSGRQSIPIEFSDWRPQEIAQERGESFQLNLDFEAYQTLWEKRRKALENTQPALRHPTELELHHGSGEVAGDASVSSLATGRLVHAYLETRLTGGFDPSVLEMLWTDCMSGPADLSAIQRAADILRNFFAGKLTDYWGRPYCDRLECSRILAQEIPVYLRMGKQAWHGVIDLILEEEEKIYAIDFKTGSFSSPLPEVYQQQEMVYGEASHRLFPNREVHFEFWWLGASDL